MISHEEELRRGRIWNRTGKLVREAIAAGMLVRPVACEQCGNGGLIEAAHHDYGKPLDVRWLCRPCHRKWDAAEPKTPLAMANPAERMHRSGFEPGTSSTFGIVLAATHPPLAGLASRRRGPRFARGPVPLERSEMETQSSTDRIQHTAGPWTDEVTDEGALIVRAANGDTVVYMGDMETTEGEDHANARLIAAAPELLAALEGMLDPDTEGDIERAIVALAKAKGLEAPEAAIRVVRQAAGQWADLQSETEAIDGDQVL